MTLTKEQAKLLSAPFPVQAHKFRIMRRSKDGNKAVYYAYLDARDIQERLSQVDPAWSSDFHLISLDEQLAVVECRLTIAGTTRVDVGASSRNVDRDGAFVDNEGHYIKGAYSDALKRAAVNFGVGAYLYRLSSRYEPIDEYGDFTEAALQSMRRRLLADIARLFPDGPANNTPPAGDELPESLDDVEELPFDEPKPVIETPDYERLYRRFHALGEAVYGAEWDAKRPELVKAVSKRRTRSSKELTTDEISRLIQGMEEILQQRQPA